MTAAWKVGNSNQMLHVYFFKKEEMYDFQSEA